MNKAKKIMTGGEKQYIIDNTYNYGIKRKIYNLVLMQDVEIEISQSDMLELLNILEANGETLDSMYSAIGSDEFCGVYQLNKPYEDISALANILFDNFIFIPADEWNAYKAEKIAEYAKDGLEDHFFLDLVTETGEGFVFDNRC